MKHAKELAKNDVSRKKMKDGVYYDRERGKLMEHYGSKISYHWTPQMEADLKRWFPTTMNKELVELFGISQRTIIRKARKMGLVKNKKWLLQVWRDNGILGYAEARRKGVLGYRKKEKELAREKVLSSIQTKLF